MSLDELKIALDDYMKASCLPAEECMMEYSRQHNPYLEFEEVQDDDSERIFLIPVSQSYLYLFRGQETIYHPCLPTLWRGEHSDIELFLERLRLVEFEHLIRQHPVVKHIFIPNHYFIDYEGLAQHYGLLTEVLDLTSDPDIALFFAMCPYDRQNDCYTYHNDGKKHTGILYMVAPFRNNRMFGSDALRKYLNDRIHPIGLQPFARPGTQRGFALHIDRNDKTAAVQYEFTFTCENSKAYYDKYEQGTALWTMDELTEHAWTIRTQKTFNKRILDETLSQFPIEKLKSRNRLKQALRSLHVTISNTVPVSSFSEAEIQSICIKWDNGGSDRFSRSISKRAVFINEGDYIDEKGVLQKKLKKLPRRSISQIADIDMFRLVMNPDCPGGGKSVWL